MPEEQDLGERDNEEADSDFPPSERRIHTQGYDLSISTLNEQFNDKTLVIPDFQREYVWDNAKASRLIESLLLNIPIPVLYFAETDEATYEIVDGHQRVYSIVRYLANQYALSGLRISLELRGKRFHQLPTREQRHLQTRVMRAVVISADSAPAMKFEVFERLNTGGLALNAQEVRNALYQGALNDFLKDLEKSKDFRFCLSTARPRPRMVDRELVLRFLALRDGLDSYKTPLARFLNDYMVAHRKASAAWISTRRTLFNKTMDTIAQVLGTAAFRVTDTAGNPSENSINRALFDAQMLVFASADSALAVRHKRRVVKALGTLFEDKVFDDSIRRATGDRARLHERVRAVAKAMVGAGVPIEAALLEAVAD